MYFRPSWTRSLYSYNINQDEWAKLPQPPYTDCGLVCIEGQLTTVGGKQSDWFGITSKVISKLFSLQGDKWKERHPPLNTARSSPAVVSTCYDGCDYIIVAGGVGGGDDWITSVEVLSNGKCYHKTDLPDGAVYPSVAVSNTTLYVISGTIGYSVSLRDLLVDNRPINFQDSPLTLQWTQLPRLPLYDTTPVCMGGVFLIVGGKDRNKGSSAIYQLWNNQFVEIGHMSEARRECLVVILSPDKMMVVGGWDQKNMRISHRVEELSVV